MTARPLTSREDARLQAMNKMLYPACLRRLPSGTFMFDYRKAGKSVRRVVHRELETAYERALIIRKNLDELPVVSARDITLEDWHSQWLQGRGGLAESTKEANSYYWKAVPDWLKAKRIGKISEEDVREALAGFDKMVMKENVGAYLSSCFTGAIQAKHLTETPWSQSKTRHKKAVNVLSAEELIKIFMAAPESTRPALALAGFYGLRLEEIMGLHCKDVDTEKRLVYIRRARLQFFGQNAREVVKGTKTGAPRVVPIPQLVLPFLVPVLEGRKGGEYLYPKYRKDFYRRLATACKEVGVPRVTFHELRHICGSNLMMQGGVAVAQAVLGHSQVGTTVDTYGHLNAVYLVRQMERANEGGEKSERLKELAAKLASSPDPEVRELAGWFVI